jgi:hypothetical protein
MLFVGHISLAFLLAFVVSLKFPDIKNSVSVALVMLLSMLPDFDVALRLVSIDLGHRTLTHSVIIWATIGAVLVCLSTKRNLKGSVAIYVISYVAHTVIGDTLVGPINVIYPLGDLLVVSPITAWSLLHMTIEAGLLTLMTAIVITRYRSLGAKPGQIFLFYYHRRLDPLFYSFLLSALIVSLFYVSNKSEITSSLYASNDVSNKILFLIILHVAAMFAIVLIWWLTWKNTKRTYYVSCN